MHQQKPHPPPPPPLKPLSDSCTKIGSGGGGVVWADSKTPDVVTKVCYETGLLELAYLRFLTVCGARISPTLGPVTFARESRQVNLTMQRGKTVSMENVRDPNALRALIGQVYVMAALGIHHGDLKITNVVMDADNTPLIIDFGLATTCAHKLGGVLGTGTYGCMPPEAVLGVGMFPDAYKIDVWCLGLVLLAQFVNLCELDSKAFFNPSEKCAYEHVLALFRFFGTPQPGASSLCALPGFEGLHKWPNWNYCKTLASYPALSLKVGDPVLFDLLNHMLVPDPEKRFGLSDVMQHPYMAPAAPALYARTLDARAWLHKRRAELESDVGVGSGGGGMPVEALAVYARFRRSPLCYLLPVATTMFIAWSRAPPPTSSSDKDKPWTTEEKAWLTLTIAATFFCADPGLDLLMTWSHISKDRARYYATLNIASETSLNPVCAAMVCTGVEAIDIVNQCVHNALSTCTELRPHRDHVALEHTKFVQKAAHKDPYESAFHFGETPYFSWAVHSVVDALLESLEKKCVMPPTRTLVQWALKSLGQGVCSVFTPVDVDEDHQHDPDAMAVGGSVTDSATDSASSVFEDDDDDDDDDDTSSL